MPPPVPRAPASPTAAISDPSAARAPASPTSNQHAHNPTARLPAPPTNYGKIIEYIESMSIKCASVRLVLPALSIPLTKLVHVLIPFDQIVYIWLHIPNPLMNTRHSHIQNSLLGPLTSDPQNRKTGWHPHPCKPVQMRFLRSTLR